MTAGAVKFIFGLFLHSNTAAIKYIIVGKRDSDNKTNRGCPLLRAAGTSQEAMQVQKQQPH